MRNESINQAMLVVLSAMFEALPPQAQRRAAVLIQDSTDLIDDLDAKQFMSTFHAAALPIK
jgi:hypothetical protein